MNDIYYAEEVYIVRQFLHSVLVLSNFKIIKTHARYQTDAYYKPYIIYSGVSQSQTDHGAPVWNQSKKSYK